MLNGPLQLILCHDVERWRVLISFASESGIATRCRQRHEHIQFQEKDTSDSFKATVEAVAV